MRIVGSTRIGRILAQSPPTSNRTGLQPSIKRRRLPSCPPCHGTARTLHLLNPRGFLGPSIAGGRLADTGLGALPSPRRFMQLNVALTAIYVLFAVVYLSADPRTCDSSTRGWRCQTPEHDADHGETDEGDNGSGITLEVAGEAPVAADPGERSLHDPAFRQDHESVRVGALNDFQLPAAGRGRRSPPSSAPGMHGNGARPSWCGPANGLSTAWCGPSSAGFIPNSKATSRTSPPCCLRDAVSS